MDMKKRIVIALLAPFFSVVESFAADWPVTAAPQLYRPGPLLPVKWTGLYFGVNAGYGWAQGSSNIVVGGELAGGNTTPLGLGATELSGTRLIGSGSLSGGIAGGQMGFNWQAGMVVFGAEVDAQWSGQQNTFSVICTTGCTASETVKIRSLTTGRARIGVAFDWLMPYVTAGGALVNARDDLTLTVGGITATFPPPSNTTLGWTAGAGFEVALSSNWSARFEYLHVRANDINSTVRIPGFLGVGTASEAAGYRDNIARFGLNYRFGPRGGPGVLEPLVSPAAYALNYDFLPSTQIFADKAKPAKHPQATSTPIVTADAAPETSSIAIQPRPDASSIAVQPRSSKPVFKNFNEIGALEDTDTLSTEPVPPKISSRKRREKEEDESQRLKRIMAICAGC
jgi:outer membrane immunogenic protein